MTTAGWETQDGRADMTNFEMDLFDTRMSNCPVDKDDQDECCKHSIIKPACLPITILAFLLLMTFFIPLFNDDSVENLKKYERTGVCTDECLLEIVESIPTGMTFPSQFKTHKSTFDAWNELLDEAQNSVDMAEMYFAMKDASDYETAWKGNQTFYNIVNTARRGVKIRIVQNAPDRFPQTDTAYLADNGLAQVRSINFTSLFGFGMLHTKLWIIDQTHIYLGSANMDWKSLTEVKELGVVIRNCSCIASDIGKIFTIYWRLGEEGAKLPHRWPINLRTTFNFKAPLEVMYNSMAARTFVSNSPIYFNPKGREHDLNAIIRLMDNATDHIRISVMDFLPTTLYMGRKNRFWPDIDNAIRAALYRGVSVQLMVSNWPHTKRQTTAYLKSLLELNNAVSGQISIKFFTVPSDKEQQKISFARVNHNKYMVTENAAYIGTSNWVGDYFINTAGIGFVVLGDGDSMTIIEEFNDIFTRDWTSQYATPVELTSTIAELSNTTLV